MSRQVKLTPAGRTDIPPLEDSDDIRVQIDLRLHLEEVVDVEARHLEAKSHRPPTKKELCKLACQIYDARRTRNRMLSSELFGEPAWDMLLALYCLPARGFTMRLTALSHASDVAESTGHRWQAVLTDKGLIERGPLGITPNKHLVRLTQKGRQLLENYLTRLFYVSTPTPPFPERAGG